MYKKVKKVILFLSILPLLLCGCWDEKIVERTGFITTLGIESSTSGEMNLTYGMPATDLTSKERWELIDTSAPLLRVGRDKVRFQSSKTIEAGVIQFVSYSKEIAEKVEISNINEVLERDPSNPILSWVFVVEGSPRELLHKAIAYDDKPRPSIYITQLLSRAAANAYTPDTRIYDFDIKSLAPGIDNIAPLLSFDSKAVKVIGSALFSKGKMVGTINPKETGLLMAMMKTLKGKKYTYIASTTSANANPLKQGLAILLGQNSKKINISIQHNKPVVDIYLDLYGYIDEYRWDNLNDEKEINKLNIHIQKQIQEDCKKMLIYLQEVNSDPIGIGDMVRAKHNNYFKGVNWHEVYKDAAITAHVKFKVIQYGAIQ